MTLFEISLSLDDHIKGNKINYREVEEIFYTLYDDPSIPEDIFYTGPAFRIIFLKRDDQKIQDCPKMNQSWTIKNDGRDLKSFMDEFQPDSGEEGTLVCLDGNIQGINVNNLIYFLSQEGFPVSKKFIHEDEVLALDSQIVSIEKINPDYQEIREYKQKL